MPKIIVQADQSAGAPVPVTLGERVVAADLQRDRCVTLLQMDPIAVEHESRRAGDVRYIDRTDRETQAAIGFPASRQRFAIVSSGASSCRA